MKTILIVDDDMFIGNMIEEALKDEDYRILRAYSGTEALMVLERSHPDLMLLDLMLPGLCGEEVLPKVRDIPVIIMSAKTGIEDKVNLLMSGAADYITKPFDIKELKARIAVQLRKNENAKNSEGDAGLNGEKCITAGNIVLDPELLSVTFEGGASVTLTRTEVAILKLLMLNAGRPIGKNTILDRISIDTPDCTERSLKQHISNIRKKLMDADGTDHITAVYGIGFKFV